MLLLVTSIKLVLEIALLAFLGQWLLGLLAGPKRETNFFYGILQAMTRPFVRIARALSPRVVIDRHVPLVAFLLLAFGWIAVTLVKINLCLQMGAGACR